MRNGIKVDYDWAFNKVVSSHDFSSKSPEWVKSFVSGWCDGFLEGYIMGSVETNIKIISTMIREGMTSEQIETYTSVSSDIIDIIRR